MKLLVHTLALTGLVASVSAQSTWFVDAAAAPGGDGTAGAPFQSINAAVQSASVVSGDTVRVAPGVYVENVALGLKGLALIATGGPLATELRASADGAVIASELFGPPVLIEGFTIRGSPTHYTTGVAATNTTVRGCVITGHRGLSALGGSGVESDWDAWVENCTIYGNRIGVSLQHFDHQLALSGSIVFGNTLEDLTTLFEIADQPIDYSLWSSGASHASVVGVGNLSLDPRLWDVANGDFALRPGSPCIDAGDPNAPLDPDGSRRDMGALAFDPTYAPGPQAYCTAKLNSLGCTPSIGASGLASATSAGPFAVLCVNERAHRAGLLFYGYAPRATPYQGGWLCVQSPTRRTSVQNAGGAPGADDCSGVYSFDFNAHIQSGVDSALVPGALVFAQYWSRDPGASAQTNRSDGLRFGVAP